MEYFCLKLETINTEVKRKMPHRRRWMQPWGCVCKLTAQWAIVPCGAAAPQGAQGAAAVDLTLVCRPWHSPACIRQTQCTHNGWMSHIGAYLISGCMELHRNFALFHLKNYKPDLCYRSEIIIDALTEHVQCAPDYSLTASHWLLPQVPYVREYLCTVDEKRRAE